MLIIVEDENESSITWKFDLKDSKHDLDAVSIYLQHTTFEEGSVKIEVCLGDKHIVFSKGNFLKLHVTIDSCTFGCFSGIDKATFDQLENPKEITLTATLVGGKSWQHAQLFRQPSDSEDCCFNVTFTFK